MLIPPKEGAGLAQNCIQHCYVKFVQASTRCRLLGCRELKSGLTSTVGVGWPAKKMMGKAPT